MSGHKLGRYWTAAALYRRGWSKELARELLPQPRIVPLNGRSVRMWSKDDVRAAEDSPRFAQRMTKHARGALRSGAALAQAWNEAEKDDSPAWLLSLIHI